MDEQAKQAILNAMITIQIASDLLQKASEELDKAAKGMKAIILKEMEVKKGEHGKDIPGKS